MTVSNAPPVKRTPPPWGHANFDVKMRGVVVTSKKAAEVKLSSLAATHLLLLIASAALVLASLCVYAWAGSDQAIWAFGLLTVGASLSWLFGRRWRTLKRDQREGAVVVTCHLVGVISGKSEHLLVKTEQGTIQLANYSGRSATSFLRRRVTLTYGRHSRYALSIAIASSDGESDQ